LPPALHARRAGRGLRPSYPPYSSHATSADATASSALAEAARSAAASGDLIASRRLRARARFALRREGGPERVVGLMGGGHSSSLREVGAMPWGVIPLPAADADDGRFYVAFFREWKTHASALLLLPGRELLPLGPEELLAGSPPRRIQSRPQLAPSHPSTEHAEMGRHGERPPTPGAEGRSRCAPARCRERGASSAFRRATTSNAGCCGGARAS